jgi:hypothetical protein
MLMRWLELTFDGAEESKCCENPGRDCGGREMEAINAVLKRIKRTKNHGRRDPDGRADLQTA